MTEPRLFDVVFVDFYGTLATGDPQAVEATCARVIADHDLPMTAGELASVWGRRFLRAIETCNHDGFLTLYDCECLTLQETVSSYVAGIDPRPYADMLKAYWADPPAAPNACAALAALETPVCVVSNADTEDIHRAIERLGLPVDAVVTSEEARSYKPDRWIFDTALERMQVRPERVLHVGDSLHSDVAGAQALGIATCWVCYTDRILDVGTAVPDYKISDLMELRAILSRSGPEFACP